MFSCKWLALGAALALMIAAGSAQSAVYKCGEGVSLTVADDIIQRASPAGGGSPGATHVYPATFAMGDQLFRLEVVADWRKGPDGDNVMHAWASDGAIDLVGFMSRPGEWQGFAKISDSSSAQLRNWRPHTCCSNERYTWSASGCRYRGPL